MIVVRLDRSEFDAQIAKLRRPGPPLARAINRSLASAQTLGARLVSRDMGLKVSVVKQFLKVRKSDANSLSATMYASAKRVPLIDFNAKGPDPSRGRGGGVRARMPGGAGRYPHAFITTVGRGRHRGVFTRKGIARLPIVELHGPSIWQSYQTIKSEAHARALEQLTKNVAHELAYALSRQAR